MITKPWKGRVVLKESLRDNTKWFLFIIAAACVVVACVSKTRAAAGLALGAVVLWFVHRIFFSRLRVSDGDVILFFGLPGSGKSMFAAKVAHDNKKDRTICVNREFEHFSEADLVFDRQDLGEYLFPPPSLLIYDEASLNGFDNRDFDKNFVGNDSLEFLKKVRQYHSSIVFTNQGWDELDKKIRSGLTNKVYYVENRGFYSVAQLLIKDISINDMTGEIQEGYRFPTFFERLLRPSVQLYVIHKKTGKLYQSFHPRALPLYPFVKLRSKSWSLLSSDDRKIL